MKAIIRSQITQADGRKHVKIDFTSDDEQEVFYTMEPLLEAGLDYQAHADSLIPNIQTMLAEQEFEEILNGS